MFYINYAYNYGKQKINWFRIKIICYKQCQMFGMEIRCVFVYNMDLNSDINAKK